MYRELENYTPEDWKAAELYRLVKKMNDVQQKILNDMLADVMRKEQGIDKTNRN